MRLPLVMIYVAVAVCQSVDGDAHAAELPDNIAPLPEVSTKGMLRGHKLEEERQITTAQVESVALKSNVSTKELDGLIKAKVDVLRRLVSNKAVVVNSLSAPRKSYINRLVKGLKDHNAGIHHVATIEAERQAYAYAALLKPLLLQGESPEIALSKINFDKELFQSPMLFVWVQYVDSYSKMFAKTELLSTLLKLYNEEALLKVVIAAKKIPSTEEITMRVLGELKLSWYESSIKHPTDIFTHLKLDKAGDELFESPLFAVWMDYLFYFNVMAEAGKEVSVFSILASKFTGKSELGKLLHYGKTSPATKHLEAELQVKLVKIWKEKKTSEDKIKKELIKAEEAKDTVFGSAFIKASSEWLKPPVVSDAL